ncbi:MAG: tetratricopeptide repeat protein [Thermodesulfovibrionales bacterium]|nr:tetratricopeptide repeat protein [Thermodesulfovibrionales bacterium]
MNRLRITWFIGFVVSILVLFSLAGIAPAEENPYDQAMKAYKKKDFKNAAIYLQEYVEQKPDPYAYYLLGYANYKLKNHAESARYFREAYVLDPNISPFPMKK